MGVGRVELRGLESADYVLNLRTENDVHGFRHRNPKQEGTNTM